MGGFLCFHFGSSNISHPFKVCCSWLDISPMQAFVLGRQRWARLRLDGLLQEPLRRMNLGVHDMKACRIPLAFVLHHETCGAQSHCQL